MRIEDVQSRFQSFLARRHPSLLFSRKINFSRSCNISISNEAKVSGSITCINANITLRDGVRVARSSAIGAGQNGKLFFDTDVHVGPGSEISVSVHSLFIGCKTTFHSNATLTGDIAIGKGCIFSPGTAVISDNHVTDGHDPIRSLDKIYIDKHGHLPNKPVRIGDDVWVGMNAIILGGVSLGDGCIVGAGSIVTRDFPAYSCIAGNPAKLIKNR
ncbi:acyltransferase [Candidatus Puniceispirillum sp.]|nr:acyltransferase [Candidatus Puniceispirillum sp.]